MLYLKSGASYRTGLGSTTDLLHTCFKSVQFSRTVCARPVNLSSSNLFLGRITITNAGTSLRRIEQTIGTVRGQLKHVSSDGRGKGVPVSVSLLL